LDTAHQRFNRRAPFGRIVLAFRETGDVVPGIGQLRSALLSGGVIGSSNSRFQLRSAFTPPRHQRAAAQFSSKACGVD